MARERGTREGGPSERPDIGRLLIAGFGSVLHGDDGFGVEVVRRLEALAPWPDGVDLVEVGTGGIHLVQRLLDGYDALLVLDAVRRDGAPGTLCLLEIEAPDLKQWSVEERREFCADMHYAEPSRALALAKALGSLPAQTLLLGCRPQSCEVLEIGLSPVVAAAADEAVAEVRRLVERWLHTRAWPTLQGA